MFWRGHDSLHQGGHGGGSGSRSHCSHVQEAEGGDCWCFAQFHRFVMFWIPATGWCPPFKVCPVTQLSQSRSDLTAMPRVCFLGGCRFCQVYSIHAHHGLMVLPGSCWSLFQSLREVCTSTKIFLCFPEELLASPFSRVARYRGREGGHSVCTDLTDSSHRGS